MVKKKELTFGQRSRIAMGKADLRDLLKSKPDGFTRLEEAIRRDKLKSLLPKSCSPSRRN